MSLFYTCNNEHLASLYEHTIPAGRPKFDHTVPTIQIVIDGDFSFSVRDIGLASGGSGGALPYRPSQRAALAACCGFRRTTAVQRDKKEPSFGPMCLFLHSA